MILEIKNSDDRRIVAGVLIDNGYTVKKVKVKAKGNRATKTCLEAEKESKDE